MKSRRSAIATLIVLLVFCDLLLLTFFANPFQITGFAFFETKNGNDSFIEKDNLFFNESYGLYEINSSESKTILSGKAINDIYDENQFKMMTLLMIFAAGAVILAFFLMFNQYIIKRRNYKKEFSKLKEWVYKARALGYNEQRIVNSLSANGWDINLVRKAVGETASFYG